MRATVPDWRPLLIGWGLAAIVLTLAMLPDIAGLRFIDPDDAMRLLEVRDLLAGQSWWDVAQHRLNRGDFPMHWSRLVDLPLAAVLALATPLVGAPIATRVAMTVVPLVTLLCIMALVAAITRRMAGAQAARWGILLVPLSVPIVYQARPMRIDHHGWQVVLALAAVALLLGRATPRMGALAGLALAALLTVSLEGLPIAAAIAGVAALAWTVDPRRGPALRGFGGSLFAGATALHLATRGPGWAQPACDAMAPAWLAMLGVAALGLTAATVAAPATRAARLGALTAAGAAAAATLLALAPGCLAGPFATLPPDVYRLWYLNVPEGRTLWEQPAYWAAMTIALPLVGLAGTVHALRRAGEEARTRWAMLLTLLLAATIIALFVNRATATANALAIPGAAALLIAMLARARAIPSVPARTAATAGALLLASPGAVAGLALQSLTVPAAAATAPPAAMRPSCARASDIRAVAALPAGIVLAPIDVAPDLIATTHHRAVAGGYHRGAEPMARVIAAFTRAPDAAEAIVRASGAAYVAGCPGLSETALYARQYPAGLWARLERGERIAWLHPVPLPGPALAWRVHPLPSPTPRP